jgi:hypothetical protein
MRIHEITDDPTSIQEITPDLFKPQEQAVKRQQKDLKIKRARIRANKAQDALRKAQQSPN